MRERKGPNGSLVEGVEGEGEPGKEQVINQCAQNNRISSIYLCGKQSEGYTSRVIQQSLPVYVGL